MVFIRNLTVSYLDEIHGAVRGDRNFNSSFKFFTHFLTNKRIS
jgi:hypothetical protein